MITIPRSEQEAFQSSIPKNLTLNFPYRDPITNENIFMESAQLEQSICEEKNLTFGMVYSSRFSVRIFDNGESYIGVRVNPRLSVTVDDRTYERSLGNYTVKSDKLTSDKLYRDLDCYDYLEDVLPVDFHEWHNGMPNTFTLRQYRNAFFQHIGLSQEDITLPNDNVLLKRFSATEFSGADILSCILQLNGAFGFINISGRFKYVLPSTTPDYSIDDGSYLQGTLNYEDEPMKPITQVIIKGFSDDYGEEGSKSIADASMGDNTGNIFSVDNNNLIQACPLETRQLLCSNLYYSIRNYSYYPASVELPAYIGMEPGDVFTIETDRKTITFPVLSRTLKGISALKDSVEAPGEVNLTTNVNMVGTGVSSVQLALDQVRESVAELLAQKASIEAQDAAIAANIAANGALTQLGIVQDVAGTLNWIREHGEFVPTTDVVINPEKIYFIREDGEYVPIVSPDPNLNPMAEGWYVLDVTSSQSEYIMAHLAVTEAGLWVLPFNTLSPHPLVDSDDNDLVDSSDNYLVDWSKDPQHSIGYKVLLSNTGMTVYDSFGNAIANYGETTTIGNPSLRNVYIDDDSVDIKDGNVVLASFDSNGVFLYKTINGIHQEIARFTSGGGGRPLLFLPRYNDSGSEPYGRGATLDGYGLELRSPAAEADPDTGVYEAIYSSQGITFNNSPYKVGTVLTGSSSGVSDSVLSGSWQKIDQIILTSGVWLVEFGGMFAASGSGFRSFCLNGYINFPGFINTDDISINNASSSYSTVMTGTKIITLSSDITLYLWAFQNSGATLASAPIIKAVKII